MSKKWTLSCLFLLLLISSVPLFSLDVSIQVIQIDRSHEKITETSYFIEDTVMDCMFNYGYITSNLPVIMADNTNELDNLCKKSIMDCKQSCSGYMAFVALDYDTSKSTNPDAVSTININKVHWYVYNLETGSRIGSDVIDLNKINYDKTDKGVNKLGLNVSSLINEALQNR